MTGGPTTPLKAVGSVALALALGTVGGAIFFQIQSPLPWLIGALCVTTAAALSGAKMHVPNTLRAGMVAVLGIMLGSAFSPNTFDRAADWVTSLAMLLVFIIVVAGLILVVLRRFARLDLVTAYFSAMPGGLSEMVIVGGAMGGDDRTISLVHSTRILIAVLAIPVWFRLYHDYQPATSVALGQGPMEMAVTDAIVLCLFALFGYGGAKWVRLPAPALTGPLILSSAAHLSGLVAVGPPEFMIAVAQVVIGAAIGCRFVGISVRRVFGTLVVSAASTVLLLGIAIAFALALEALTGLPFAALILAFAPGGLAEMSLISLALGIDPAFVSTHHFVRIVFIVIVVPLAFRLASGYLDHEPPSRN